MAADRNQVGSSERTTSNRGFASMDEERQHEIASKGGQSVPGEKRSFSQDRRLAAEAGRNWCRRRELNPRPTVYKTVALPLSYAGDRVQR